MRALQPPSRIAHIAIAVKQINTVMPFYEQVLGLQVERREEITSERVHVAFIPIGNSYLELLEPADDECSIAHFINKKGEGIHHIAFEVMNLQERITHYALHGVPVIGEQIKEGALGMDIAFIHPKAAHNVLVELCQPRGADR